MIQHPCNYPGCFELTTKRFCPEHYKKWTKGSVNKAHNVFYSSGKWRNAQQFYIKNHPICEHCKRKPAKIVHHIIPVKDRGALVDENNLMAVCTDCHEKVEWQAIQEKKEKEKLESRYKWK